MADSAVEVTAGSGTNIDTRTEGTNNNHRQVVVLGDPATNAGVAPVDGTAGLKVDLGADNDVTISGTVTVGSHAVTNAGTFAVQVDGLALTSLQLIDDTVQVLGTDTYVEATSRGLTIGAVRRDADTTLVNTTNEFGPLQMDANGRLKVEAFSGETLPISGTVTVNALPSGTNNIGDVDVLSVIPGSGATNLGKARNAAHADNDVGVMALAVRQSSQADLGADGDYVPLSIDDDGAVRVAIISGAGSGGTASTDDADFTATSTSGTPGMGVYESSPTSVTDGDMGIVGITQTRAMRTQVEGGTASIGKAQDSATGATHTGAAIMGVRDDALSTITPAEGDYAFARVNARGATWVAIDPAETGSLIAVGTAGSPSSEVISVQGVTSMTPLEIGPLSRVFDLTLSVDTAAYSSGDVIADSQQCDAFFRKSDGTGVIQSLTVCCEADQKAAIDIYFLNANSAMGTENAAPSISDANSNNVLGWVSVAAADYKDLGGTSVACIRNIGLVVKATSGTDDLYVAVVSNASTPDYVNADDLILRIGALLD